jgi:hypothetical protein
LKNLEKNYQALKEENSELYKQQASNAQKMLLLMEKSKENDIQKQYMESKHVELDSELKSLHRKVNDLNHVLKEKDGVIEVPLCYS